MYAVKDPFLLHFYYADFEIAKVVRNAEKLSALNKCKFVQNDTYYLG